jgi:heme/copper-type cytochrome/quinol oxidase subunit 2
MTTKNKIVSVVVIVLVALVIVVVVVMNRSSSPTTAPGNNQTQATTPTTSTRAPAPVDVTVPSQNATATAPDVAVPQIVSPANAHSTSDYRSFSITADNNQFTPSTIIVNQGDIVNIVMTAVGKTYDFTQPDYGFKQTILAGQTKTIQFGATAAGQFTFYCTSCGGPMQGPTGTIIVVAK